MAYTFNPFTGTFDNAPSTLKGDSAYTTLCAISGSLVDQEYLHSTGCFHRNRRRFKSAQYVENPLSQDCNYDRCRRGRQPHYNIDSYLLLPLHEGVDRDGLHLHRYSPTLFG